MTKDFRNVGRLPEPATSNAASVEDTSTATAPAARAQTIVLGTIYFAAIGFFLAGLWLVNGGTGPFPQESARFIGFAFIIAAVADVMGVMVIKRAWARRTPR